MKVAKQRVRVWGYDEEDPYAETWITLRAYINEVGLANLRPWRIYAGMTEAKAFHAPGILDCDPGGPNSDHSADNEYRDGRLVQSGREKQYIRWKKGNCAYIYYAGPSAGLCLMLPAPLKVTVEVKVQV